MRVAVKQASRLGPKSASALTSLDETLVVSDRAHLETAVTPVDLFELILILIAAALLLSFVASRLSLPPAAALVIGGIALALIPQVPAVALDPDLILVLFLPPLLLSSAYMTVWRDFRAQLTPILVMSVGAVVFTTCIVGIVAKLVVPGLPWAACFALGAIVSPPDAVSAKSVRETLRIPRRMMTILEGESLVNDASGLVLYRFAVAAAMTGVFDTKAAAASFVWLAVGGIAIGVAVGFLVSALLRRSRNADFTIVITFLSAWTVYILAERVHASGVLAVVACGLVYGWTQHEILSANTRVQAGAVWAVVTFVLEAFVFVLIGLAARGVLDRMGGDVRAMQAALHSDVPLVLAVTAAVVLSRFLWVFPAIFVPRLVSKRLRARDKRPASVAVIISWAGMRGVVSLAAALALPDAFPGRDKVLLATFGVILATVLVQGITLGPLIKALKLDADMMIDVPIDEARARLAVAGASLRAIEAIEGVEPGAILHPQLVEEYRSRVSAVTRLTVEGEVFAQVGRDHFSAALVAVAAGRAELIRLHRDSQIHATTLDVLEQDLDLEELRLMRMATLLKASEV